MMRGCNGRNKFWVVISLLATIMISSTGCSGSATPSASSGSGTWAGLGVSTKSDTITGVGGLPHAQYMVDSHATLSCVNCHASGVARESICVNCHPLNALGSSITGTAVDLSTVTTNANHVTLSTGTHCNACHYSNNGSGAGQGWRWPTITDTTIVSPTLKTRINHAQWHGILKGVCLKCHPFASITLPSAHPSVNSSTACESCHYYLNGKWGGRHILVSSGCNQSGCHATHAHSTVSSRTITSGQSFGSIDCANCHQASVSGSFANWLGAGHESVSNGCNACHQYHHNSSDCVSCHSVNYSSWSGARD